jgi:hypothetical protein
MPSTKQARAPMEGVYYVAPVKKGGVHVLSQREDDSPDTAHMFYWPKVLNYIAEEFGFTPAETAGLHTNYQAIPRGRVQKELDSETFKETGRYIVLHGGDIPEGNIKYAVHQDFGLIALYAEGRVVWREEEHEKMDPSDRAEFLAILKRHNGK